ncbi:MAG: GH1 family beta-glucosidase [Brevinematia bacterium]
MSLFSFPEDFIFGTATASYQVEGAVNEDGRGESVWDRFCRLPGRVWNNDTGDVACDQYHLYKEDVKLMKELNLNAYRFSIAWPRIFPTGEGKPNPKGLDYYHRLIDELLKNDIKPFVTLFHWDLPQALEEKYGGWRSKEVSKLFADYSAYVVKNLRDKVEFWSTINEISCFTILAHLYDKHAPGKIESSKVTNQTVHNALLGHGLALKAIRENGNDKTRAGIVENLWMAWPVYEEERHINAAKKAFYDRNQQILFPFMTGRYSEKWLKEVGENAPEFTEEEMKLIGGKLDFVGLNMYMGHPVRFKENKDGYEILSFPSNFPKTYMEWPITPKAVYASLKFTKEYFGDIPIYITENGMAGKDVETKEGEVLDIDRLEYLRMHLEMVSRAIMDNIPVKGYFIWSLLDNFEWSYGYDKRFGIVRVNYSNQKRTIKLSGEYYRDVTKHRRVL